MITQSSIDTLMENLKIEYGKWGIGMIIHQYTLSNRHDEHKLGEYALVRKQALFQCIEDTPTEAIENHRETLINERRKSLDAKRRHVLKEKIGWTSYYLLCNESMSGKPLPKEFPSIYDVGENLYNLMEEYLIGLMKEHSDDMMENGTFFFEGNERTDIRLDVNNWIREKTNEGKKDGSLVKVVVDQIMGGYWQKHFCAFMDKDEFKDGFMNYVENSTASKMRERV